MHRGDVRRARVDEFAVHLVAEEEEVVLLHQVADLVHLVLGIEVARRVVGIADEDGLRALVDEFLELLHLGQAETLVDGGRDGPDHRAGGDREGHIVGVRRLRDDDLVARIEAAHECEQHRLGAARGDDDLVRGELDLVALIVVHERLAQRAEALRRAVFQHLAVYVLEHVERLLRRRQVGLADVQAVDLHSPLLGGVRQRGEHTDGRCRHLQAAVRYPKFIWHIAIPVNVP